MPAFNEMSLPLTLADGTQTTLAYRAWGNPSANRSVMMVHGLTRNGSDFDRLAARVAKDGAFVLCPDMPGRGRSDWLARADDYAYEIYIQALHAVMAEHEAPHWQWVGTSMGGILGMMMAAAPFGLITELVLNDIGEKVPAAGMRRIAAYASRPQFFHSCEEAVRYMMKTYASFGLRSEEEWLAFTQSSIEPSGEGWTLAYDPKITARLAAYLDADAAMTDLDFSAFWQEIRCPTLLLRGEHSDILTADVAKGMGAKHFCKLVTIPDTGHAPALMETAQLSMVADWLAQSQ